MDYTLDMAQESPSFAICVDNEGYMASLERRKLYEIVSDAEAERACLIRVIDESGEDYLFPDSFFVRIHLSADTLRAVTDLPN